MATQKFANNASAVLAASISSIDTTIQVASGFGSLFPSPGAGEFFLVALQNAAGTLELVKISSRTGDNLTVASSGRGQEGTSAAAWTLNVTRVELRLTRDTMVRFVQQESNVVVNDLTIPGLTVTGALIGNTLAVTSATVGGVSVNDAALITSGTFAAGRLGGGSINANTFLAGDQTFKTVNFTQLGGTISNAQTPQAAVTQHQAALSIAGTQLTGGVNASYLNAGTLADARVALSNVSQHAGSISTRNVPGLAGTAVTIQSDPGGTPSGTPGDLFLYY
jgi:hypothetical protein